MGTFDAALTPESGGLKVRFPSPLSRALMERGYNRAEIEITERGLVVRPYVEPKTDTGRYNKKNVASIPEWNR